MPVLRCRHGARRFYLHVFWRFDGNATAISTCVTDSGAGRQAEVEKKEAEDGKE